MVNARGKPRIQPPGLKIQKLAHNNHLLRGVTSSEMHSKQQIFALLVNNALHIDAPGNGQTD